MFEEPTYCDGCKKFSSGPVCPHCEVEPAAPAPEGARFFRHLLRALGRDQQQMLFGAAGAVVACALTGPHTVAETVLMLGAPMGILVAVWLIAETVRYRITRLGELDPRE